MVEQQRNPAIASQTNARKQFVDNFVDLNVFTTSPTAGDNLQFEEQNKDMILGNLDAKDLLRSRRLIKLIGLSQAYGLPLCYRFFMREVSGLTNTSRAKGGRASELLVTQINKSVADYNENLGSKKPFTMFGKKEER